MVEKHLTQTFLYLHLNENPVASLVSLILDVMNYHS